VCDFDRVRAENAAAEFGVPHHFGSAGEMLASGEIDFVDLVTQMDTHEALVGMAMDRGIPTIVQKPFGPDLETCRRMVKASENAGTFLAVHENFRFQAPLRRLKEMVESGAIGSPNWARISFRTGHDIYAGQPYLRDVERFVLLDVGTHVLDLARFLLGEVTQLSAETQRRNPAVTGEDTATVLCRHETGAVSVVEATYESRRVPDIFPQVLVEIEGERGAVALREDYVIERTSQGGVTRIEAEPPLLPWAERPWHVVQDSVFNTCRHLARSIQAGERAETDARDNLRTFALCEAAYESAASRRFVTPAA
jgi:predicted dehydrogenase